MAHRFWRSFHLPSWRRGRSGHHAADGRRSALALHGPGGLATTASGVLNAAGGYLDSHPGANDVLTAAVSQSPEDARSSVRGYFASHPNEALDLNNIAQPLRDLRKQCNVSVTLSQLAMLGDAVLR